MDKPLQSKEALLNKLTLEYAAVHKTLAVLFDSHKDTVWQCNCDISGRYRNAVKQYNAAQEENRVAGGTFPLGGKKNG